MFILCGILAGVLIGIADIFLFVPKKRVATCIHTVICDAVLANLFALAAMKYLLEIPNIFAPELHGALYPLKYLALTLAFGIAVLTARGFLTGALQFEVVPPKHKIGAWVLRICSALFFGLGVAAYTGTIWGKKTFGEITPDQMLINLNSPTEGTSSEVMTTLFEGPVLQTALLVAVFCVVAFSVRNIVYGMREKKVTVFSGLTRRILCFILFIRTYLSGRRDVRC